MFTTPKSFYYKNMALTETFIVTVEINFDTNLSENTPFDYGVVEKGAHTIFRENPRY